MIRAGALHLAAGHRGAARAQQLHVHPFASLIPSTTTQATASMSTLALNKNWFFQLGVSLGTDTAPWHWGQKVSNPFPNAVFPGTTMLRDPGAKPSVTAGVALAERQRHGTTSTWSPTAINDGTWGYNNLQWYGITLVSQLQFAMALLVGGLRARPEEGAQCRRSSPHHRQWRLSVRAAERIAVQCAGLRALQQPLCRDLHGGGRSPR